MKYSEIPEGANVTLRSGIVGRKMGNDINLEVFATSIHGSEYTATCLNIKDGAKDIVMVDGEPILRDGNENFSKSQLKSGMRVILENGAVFGVIEGMLVAWNMAVNPTQLSLSNYDEYLNNVSYPRCSVNKIQTYNPKSNSWESVVRKKERNLVWRGSAIRVLILDKKVTVELFNGIQGSAECLPEDTFDENKGIDIAFHKAIIKYHQESLKKLIEGSR